MNVGKIQHVLFRGSEPRKKPEYSDSEEIKITELNITTPDFGVQTPQKYSKLGVTKLDNGLEIHSYKLANGHKVTIVPMENSPTTVKNYVNVGSMNETDDIKGISHFLEHMAFNGTNGTEGYIKLDKNDSFKKIDELGGYTNASTNYALTDYVNITSMLNDKDLEKQIQVIAAMTEDLKLSEDMVEKEKFPVCSEIDMILDSPETIAIDQTVRSLFNIRSSADELVGGSVNHIQNLDRQKVLDYYNKYYTPDNMHLVITGDVNPDEVMQIVSKNFRSNKISQGKKYDERLIPISENVRKDFITDKASSANICIGFAIPPSKDVKSNIISEIIYRYIQLAYDNFAGELEELGAVLDIGSEKISTNPNNPGLMGINIRCSEENVEKVLKLVYTRISKLSITDENIINSIKKYKMMEYNNALENSSYLNDMIGKSEFNGDLDFIVNFKSILESITADDINDYIKKYFDVSKSAVTVIHPETTKDEIINNYEKAKSISFQGHSKLPVNMEKVSVTELDNNYRLGFSESKNNNVAFEITYEHDLPKDLNPALYKVLDYVLDHGTKDMTGSEFDRYIMLNNVDTNASCRKGSLTVNGCSTADNFRKSAEIAAELLYNPRITPGMVKEAVAYLKDKYSRYDNSASDLYEKYESENNPYYGSADAILEGLDKVTVEDVQNLYDYIMNNSKGYITINIPESSPSIKTEAYNEFSKLKSVLPLEYKLEKIYKENPKSAVLTEARNVSQAEINQTYKFQTDGSIKELVTGMLMNSILSSSDTIGLFNSLREQNHLAYRVNSYLQRTGDCGEINLYILTSTDNKDTGITSYDNLQKSINGFHRQINKLLNSEYKDSDLEAAKLNLKTTMLHQESVYSRLDSIGNAISRDESLDYDNRWYEIIDSITREDIDNYAKKVFAGKPVYSIVASQDTLDYNKEFLSELVK